MDYGPATLQEAALQPNYFFGLMPKPGYAVPLRVLARSFMRYTYDPLSTSFNTFGANNATVNTPIPSKTFVAPFLLGSQVLNSTDVFQPLLPYTVYQLFFAWSPPGVRMFKSVPSQEKIGTLENISTNVWSSANPEFGYIDYSLIGFPKPSTEVILPQNVEFGPAFYNPLPFPAGLLLEVWINKLRVETVKDPKVAAAILRGNFGTLKSISADLTADGVELATIYGDDAISLAASDAQITAALASAKKLNT